MSRRLVITGVDGFVGRHLARIAVYEGYEVHGVSRSEEVPPALAHLLAGYTPADLRAEWPEAGVPRDAAVVHLAGLAAVGPSFDAPQDYLNGNTAMVTNLFESRTRAGAEGRIVVVSTGAVYATLTDEVSRDEASKVACTSPYVVSKLAVENQVAYYRTRGVDAVITRPFNHFGPGQGPGFIVPDLLAGIRRLSRSDELAVGNLSTRRDYTDVRDVARAYLQLVGAETLAHGVYNIASGVSRSGAEVLAALCAADGRPVPLTVVDTARTRANDPAEIVGDASRLRDEVGWAPQVTFAETIADVVSAA